MAKAAGYPAKRSFRHGVTAVFVLVTLLISVFSPLSGEAATVKATTEKGTSYTVRNGIVGIDVSKWQGDIDWKKVSECRNYDVKFAFIRSTYGTTVDPTFVDNAKNAYRNRIHVGAYHFATFKNSADVRREAAVFLRQIEKVNITYPLVLDIEYHHNLSRKQLTDLVLEFCRIVQRSAGHRVMIYTYSNFYRDRLEVSRLSGYPLWVANYNTQPNDINHVVWQHTSKGRVSGIKGDVDINVAYRSLYVGHRKPGPTVTDVSAGSGAGTNTGTGANTSANTNQNSSNNAASRPESPPREVQVSLARPISRFLDQHYSEPLRGVRGADLEDIPSAVAFALQIEINKQLGGNAELTGRITGPELEKLAELPFTVGTTKGRITTLLQIKLHLSDCLDAISGQFDDNTVRAIRKFQSQSDLEPDGKMNQATWKALLGV